MKSSRHALILQLIEDHDVETQDDLAALLRDSGVSVTQATVSRDIKELRLVKVQTGGGKYKYATVENAETGLFERFMRIFSQSVISVKAGGNIVVVKTLSGSANAAAEAIDSLRYPEVVGTIAGDNTIFVAIENEREADEIAERFRGLMR